MEPEMGAWSTLEYIAISTESAASGSDFYLTSVPPSLVGDLPESLRQYIGAPLKVTSHEVTQLSEVHADRVCLLDPQAEKELSPADAEVFDAFVFGGILGDDPPRDRTAELRKYGYQSRQLGKLQMTTDTAVRATRMVIEEQQPLAKIPYVDYPELKLNKNESTQMPFRYVKGKDGEPYMPQGMLELIKKDADKSFDDFF
ncbi:SAM-dependent RNA methyltransferase [Tuber borchii]|uniref:SAM-dependent RNA methyltransferase n=1 Tax=Tuber borchii TaxID=42251 RepID=A0A2T7A9N6_TUBBO|nr:SAM-dependent RNA methyltransferase [Tuber borchii]